MAAQRERMGMSRITITDKPTDHTFTGDPKDQSVDRVCKFSPFHSCDDKCDTEECRLYRMAKPSTSFSSLTPETDAAFKDIYRPPYRVGLTRLANLLIFVRGLERARNHNRICVERLVQERLLLAKLAAKEPQFFSPLAAMEAEALRDRILEGNNSLEITSLKRP